MQRGEIDVLAEDLHRILYNTKMVQVGAQASDITLSFSSSWITMSCDDNHTYVQDVADCRVDEPLVGTKRLISPTVAKDLEMALRTMEGTMNIDFGDGTMRPGGINTLTDGDTAIDECPTPFTSTQNLPGILEDYLYQEMHGTFALRPEYMRKLGLVKPGGYPLDMKLVNHQKYGELVLVKAGPTCRLALTTMDHDKLLSRDDARQILW